jgi:hypothetical protein
MLKWFKEWAKDYNELQRELNRYGIFTVYHQFGASTHYIGKEKTTHINNIDDRQNTVSKNNK